MSTGSEPKTHTFSEALAAMRDGCCMQRIGWNNKKMFVCIENVNPNPEGRNDRAVVVFTPRTPHRPGWMARSVDMCAKDWVIVDGAAIAAGHPTEGQDENTIPRTSHPDAPHPGKQNVTS